MNIFLINHLKQSFSLQKLNGVPNKAPLHCHYEQANQQGLFKPMWLFQHFSQLNIQTNLFSLFPLCLISTKMGSHVSRNLILFEYNTKYRLYMNILYQFQIT